jgi:hypothetical protein
MEIATNDAKREVEDFDIVSVTGLKETMTVDVQAGDSFEQLGDRIVFKLVAQKSPLNPEITLQAEEVSYVLANTFSIRRRKRIVTDPTPEQKAQLAAWIKSTLQPPTARISA